jgi:IclR family KDG regulon transcriptional repressor
MASHDAGAGVKSVDLAFRVLEAVAAAEDGAGVSELASLLGTTKPTIFRHLQTLRARGYVAQDSTTARYSLGIRAHLLSQGAGRINVMVVAEAEARLLRDEAGETAVVSLITATALVVGVTARGHAPIEIGVRPGSELALHATAQGKVALAFSRHPLLERALRQGLTRHTEATIVDPDLLRAEIERIRSVGYAVACEEEARGISAIAAPIFDESADCIGAIALVGLVQSIKASPELAQLEALLRAAERISRRLGFRPESPRETASSLQGEP